MLFSRKAHTRKKDDKVVVGILPEKKGHAEEQVDEGALKQVTENLYKQNLELAVKNKTLSLLRQLYQISILTLEPKELAQRVATTIRDALEFELVGIFLYDEPSDTLTPLECVETPRLAELQEKHKVYLNQVAITNVTKREFFELVIKDRVINHREGLLSIWNDAIPVGVLEEFQENSHIKTTLGYPLVTDGAVTGVILISINRSFENLAQFEKDSIASFGDVTAVALDKSRLYQELKVTNNKLSDANNRLKELDKLKSEFVSLATHQIRAPLTSIKGYISLVKEGDFGPVTPEVLGALDIVFQSTNNLVTIVGDFLDVSRIEQGKMKYDFTDFDAQELVNQVVIEQKPNVEKKGLVLNYVFEQGKNYMIHGDRGKIKQVVGNIIDNSIKYTPQGSIGVDLSHKDDKILVKVFDTGVGIPQSTIPKLFQKFTRAANANETNILGTGLGLYVAKQMIEAHKGRVWAESEGEGKGAQFYIELPLHATYTQPAS